MLKTLRIILAFATLLPTLATAQNRAHNQSGYIVTMQGDTMRGVLDIPRFVSEEGLTFRSDKQDVTKTLTARDLSAFGLQDGRRFVKRTVANGRNTQTGGIDSAVVFMQHLVAGSVNFYRHEFNPLNNRTEAGPASSESIHYFIDAGSRNLIRLSARTYLSTLPILLKDCPAMLEQASRTTFNEQGLGNLIVRYNTQCHTTPIVHDYRPAEKPSTAQLLLSVRGGGQRGQLWYTLAPQLSSKDSRTATMPSFGVELRLANAGPWSVSTGVQYAHLRRETIRLQSAYLGTINAGEQLALPYSVQTHSVQAPLLLRYTLGHSLVRPYLAAGALFGQYINNETKLSYTTLNYVDNTSSARTDVVVEQTNKLDKAHFTVGSTARLGLQFKTSSRITPLLELQYSAGRDSNFNSGFATSATVDDLGDLHYQTLSLVAGLEF